MSKENIDKSFHNLGRGRTVYLTRYLEAIIEKIGKSDYIKSKVLYGKNIYLISKVIKKKLGKIFATHIEKNSNKSIRKRSRT